ncbi:MAG: hypothetical protein HYX68_09460 [Planctomycetes bacterium]|nr:hypothetical protein [Planctomycetota bacterium]
MARKFDRFGCLAAAWVTLGCLAAIGFAPTASAQGDPTALRDRFLTEAPVAWEKAMANFQRLQGRYSIQIIHNGKMRVDTEIELKQNAHCKMQLARLRTGKDENLDAYNRDYSFSLTRKKDRAWVLAESALKIAKRKLRADQIDDSVKRSWAYSPVTIRVLHLAELVKQPNFKVVSVQAVAKDNLIEVAFDNKHSVKNEPFCSIQGGKLYLDPSRSWCLRSAVVKNEYANGADESRHILGFSDQSPNSCIPRRLVIESIGYDIPDGKTITEKRSVTRRIKVDFEVEEPVILPADEEFTLSAFGLPEPEGIERASSRWYLWFIAIAAVSLIVGFYLLRRSGRPSAATPASGS